MPLRETLQKILTEYLIAKNLPLEGHTLAGFIRHDAAHAVDEGLGELGAGLIVEGSPGQGNWAAVPWISVFDPAITTSATRRASSSSAYRRARIGRPGLHNAD
jgi:5-methylcytosine-specific restriction enzyme A